MLILLTSLIFWHFILDFPLQGDFLSKAKNKYKPIDGIPWIWPMTAHSFIHGAGVYIVLGVWWISLFEFISHFIIDTIKCKGLISFNIDQILHITLKFVWLGLAMYSVY